MLFNSFKFWLLFILIFALYWLIPSKYRKARKWYLIIVSYALYMNFQPSFAIVLFGVTMITYLGALVINKFDDSQTSDSNHTKRKVYGIGFAVLALLPLLTFKYYNFINQIVFSTLDHFGLYFDSPGLNWAIPVGISFFTFQALGYYFDVYRRKETAEKCLSDYILFCSFFPQTASGPISTASELLPQIKSEKKFVFSHGVEGLKYVLWGLVLKCVFADRLGLYVNTVMNNYEHFSGLNCAIAAIFFTLQIYGDFAGYSLMAIGIAKTLGFHLVNNFDRPYFADSVTNFWRKWHISLTRWLTKHVYIPLGGSRCSKPRQYANIMATFLVSGLWHGANYTFIFWGGLHGVAQIAEKSLGIDPKGKHANNKWLLRVKPLRIILTFILVTVAWVFFRMPTISDAWNFIIRIFTDHSAQEIMYKATNSDKLLTFFAILLVFIAELRAEYLKEKTKWLDSSWARWLIYVALFAIIIVFGVLDAGSFIYVNF
ncbi:MAG: MBOAT family protein [Muribaculaceae bacterium]|nr:MBOAT family protein [Muribaculaceae bacterium]